MKVQEKRQVAVWVEAARKGEESALDKLFRFYTTRLTSWFRRRVVDPYLVEDLVQETLIRGLEGLTNVRDPWRYDAWICRVARRTAVDAFKRKNPRACDPDLLKYYEEMDSCKFIRKGELQPNWEEVVDKAIARLSPEDGDLVREHHGQGVSVHELASRNGTSLSGIKMRLFRARRRLRPFLALSLQEETNGIFALSSHASIKSKKRVDPYVLKRRRKGCQNVLPC